MAGGKRRRPAELDANDAPEDWDPEDEELDSRAAASLQRAKDRAGGAASRRGDPHGAAAAGRSALRTAAASAALEDDPRYSGRVVASVRAASRKRDAALPLSDDDDDAGDGDDGGDGGGVAPEDDEDIGDDEVDGVDEEEDEEDDDEEGEDDEDAPPELEGVSRGAGVLPPLRGETAVGGRKRARAAAAEDDDDDDDHAAAAATVRRPPSSSSAAFLGDLDAELAALERADAAAVSRRAAGAADDAATGRAARASIALYEGALEARIRLQGALAGAARLPPRRLLDALLRGGASTGGPSLSAALDGAAGALRRLLGDLLRVRAATLAQLPEVASASATATATTTVVGAGSGGDAERALLSAAGLPPLPGAKRRRLRGEDEEGDEEEEDDGEDDEEGAGAASAAAEGMAPPSTDRLWACMQAQWDASAAWRTGSLDRWGRKLAFASGLSAKAALKLKVLSTSVPQQVASLLAAGGTDRQRLFARSQPLASAVGRVLGVPPPTTTSAAAVGSSSSGGGGGDSGGTDAVTAGGGGTERVCDAYDDSDFYTALLKEFVASASASSLAAVTAGGGGGSGGVGPGGVAKAHPRAQRPGVDRRATKGRRLQFAVQPKLVAFVAPAPYVVPPELAFDLDTLVASLFRS